MSEVESAQDAVTRLVLAENQRLKVELEAARVEFEADRD